jgi:hypothetical protein
MNIGGFVHFYFFVFFSCVNCLDASFTMKFIICPLFVCVPKIKLEKNK